MNVGDRVVITRDEKQHPPKGTWHRYRGMTGTIVTINRDAQRPHLTEYGVTFGKVTQAEVIHKRRLDWNSEDVVWFKLHELRCLSPRTTNGENSAQRGAQTPSDTSTQSGAA